MTIAAGAIASLKQQVAEEKVRQGKRANFELAADALAAQMPRLELYDTLKVLARPNMLPPCQQNKAEEPVHESSVS